MLSRYWTVVILLGLIDTVLGIEVSRGWQEFQALQKPWVHETEQVCVLPNLKELPEALVPAWEDLEWVELEDDKALVGEPRHYGQLIARWVENEENVTQIQFETIYWDGSDGPIWRQDPITGFWYSDLVDDPTGPFPIEIRVFRFSRPFSSLCGDRVWLATDGLNWPSTGGVIPYK